MSKTTTRGGFRSTQKLPFNPRHAGWEGKPHQTVASWRTPGPSQPAKLSKVTRSHCSPVVQSPLTRSVLDSVPVIEIVFPPPCLSVHILEVSQWSSKMTKIQLDYYLQAAAVPPGLGQLQCFFLLNLDRISVGFLLKTVPGYSWASACATVRRTSSYQEYLFSSPR